MFNAFRKRPAADDPAKELSDAAINDHVVSVHTAAIKAYQVWLQQPDEEVLSFALRYARELDRGIVDSMAADWLVARIHKAEESVQEIVDSS